MNVLIIGGNRFVGYLLAWKLLARGDKVTLFNRGTIPDPFAGRVERIHGDRTKPEFAELWKSRGGSFDAVIDFAAYKKEDLEPLLSSPHRPHYIFISTGQVYLVRLGAKWPASEADYDGPVMPKPTDEAELSQWTYGAEKRDCEDALFSAHRKDGFRFTTFRIPMVSGARDYFRRIEGYLYRLLDGGPLLLPDGGGHTTRHVYAPDVASIIARVLGDRRVDGRAYNLSQDERPTLNALLTQLSALLGAPLRTIDIPRAEVVRAGLEPVFVSPFSGLWMSQLDPALAKAELGFAHCPLDQYLRTIVETFIAHPPADPPERYAARAQELELARRFET